MAKRSGRWLAGVIERSDGVTGIALVIADSDALTGLVNLKGSGLPLPEARIILPADIHAQLVQTPDAPLQQRVQDWITQLGAQLVFSEPSRTPEEIAEAEAGFTVGAVILLVSDISRHSMPRHNGVAPILLMTANDLCGGVGRMLCGAQGSLARFEKTYQILASECLCPEEGQSGA